MTIKRAEMRCAAAEDEVELKSDLDPHPEVGAAGCGDLPAVGAQPLAQLPDGARRLRHALAAGDAMTTFGSVSM